jgi:biotin carboxyl carrier protein
LRRMDLEWNGKVVSVWAELIGENLWFHWQGQTHCYRPERKRSPREAAAIHGSGEVKAPMPGKITKIVVNQGAQVVAHQPVVIMEAMKMEYTLKSEIAGSVREVLCQVGQQVTLGQKLAIIVEK